MSYNNLCEEELACNVLAGALPECLQLDTISAIFSEKLRHLPTKNCFFTANPKNSTAEKMQEIAVKTKPKIVWHLNKKRKYFTFSRSLAKRACLFIVF